MTRSVSTKKYLRLRQFLVDARRDAGLTQSEVADLLNRPQSFVSKYECGERRLDVIEFLEVAEALGQDPGDFIRTLKTAEKNH